MYAQSFRDIDAYGDSAEWGRKLAFQAFWAVALDKTYGGPVEKSDALLKWTNETLAQLLQWREGITRVQRMNSQLYKGRHYLSQGLDPAIPYLKNRQNYDKNHAKIVLNYVGQAVDQHVAEMAGYEPSLICVPSNDEEEDRVAARTGKNCLDHYNYTFNLKTAFSTFHRRKKVHGETFAFMLWDESAGDYHPKYKEWLRIRREMGLGEDTAVPLTDPNTGEQILGTDGKPLFIQQAVRVGDLSLKFELSERVLYPCPDSYLWDDVPWVIRMVPTDVDEVKYRWPHVADLIKEDGLVNKYMYPMPRSLTSKVWVRYLYHKPTRFLPDGYYMATTETAVLEVEPRNIANHELLPCIRGTDVDVDFDVTAMSFIQNLTSLQHGINNSTSMILQNQALFAYPKYVSPRGAKVKYAELGNDRGIYEYSGPQAPEIMAANSTPPDTWRFADLMQNHFKTLSGIFPTSQGTPPQGITANVALRMLDEQERKFRKPAIDKHATNVQTLGRLILATLGTYRQPDDGALISILGKNNERYMRYFDTGHLGFPTQVHLLKSGGLPDSPAAKTQTVLDITERFPELWSGDEVLEYLDIARPEKLIQSATVARQSAESEMEDLLAGQMVPPPESYHDLLPRYRVYEKTVQSRGFDEADPFIKQRVFTHIMTAEYLITLKMQLNMTFANEVLVKHPNFPMFFPGAPTPLEPFMLAQPPMPMGGPGADPLGGMPLMLAGPEGQTVPQEGPVPTPGPTPTPTTPQDGTVPAEGALP